MGAFQRMFSVSLHCTGGFCPGAAIPSRVGPRHAGQSVGVMVIEEAACADKARLMMVQIKAAKIILFIRVRAGSLANTG